MSSEPRNAPPPLVAEGLIDAHVQLMPDRFQAALRRHLQAHLWHPRFQGSAEQAVDTLRAGGVQAFVFGGAAHAEQQARSMSYWASNAQGAFGSGALGLGTAHPGDDEELPRLVDEVLGPLRLSGLILHPGRGSFALDDDRLSPVYERLIAAQRVLVVHAGRRPEPAEQLGARALERLLRRFPELRVLVQHMGADEFEAFFDLCDRYPGVHFETAMVFNNYLGGPPPIQRVIEFHDRVLFGSGFPNIPFDHHLAVQAILDLKLGAAIEARLFRTNAARLFSLDLALVAPRAASGPGPGAA